MRRLKQMRLERGLTQRQVGFLGDLDPRRVGQIESGAATPPDGSIELARLAKALKFKGDPARLLEEVTDEVKA